MGNNHLISGDYEKGTITEYMFKAFSSGKVFDIDEMDIEELSYELDLVEKQYFLEGVVNRLKQLGVECAVEDTEVILSEVRDRFKKRLGVPLYEKHKAIEQWIKGIAVPSVKTRKTNFDLCYALEMNLEETKEFFLKSYLSIPFNMKNRTDAVFFYCLLRNRPYEIIKSMLEESKAYENNRKSMTETRMIGEQVASIEDDEEFMKYLSSHCYSEEQQYHISRNLIKEIIAKYTVKEKVEEETEEKKKKKIKNFAKLYLKITGINYQSTVSVEKLKKGKQLPKEFMESFPTDRTLWDIDMNNKKETYETLRKTLIILCFYDFYQKASNVGGSENFNDFCSEIDDKLWKCGFAPLYPRHPFDAIMMACAVSKEPLNKFKEVNALRYSEE